MRRGWIVTIIAIVLILAVVLAIVGTQNSYVDSSTTENISEGKNYIGKSVEECSRITYICAPGFQGFMDDKGCGCEIVPGNGDNGLIRNKCSPESRGADACITLYQPVCGWYGKNTQCLNYPCAETYSNSCFACMDEKVEYWTADECPKA